MRRVDRERGKRTQYMHDAEYIGETHRRHKITVWIWGLPQSPTFTPVERSCKRMNIWRFMKHCQTIGKTLDIFNIEQYIIQSVPEYSHNRLNFNTSIAPFILNLYQKLIIIIPSSKIYIQLSKQTRDDWPSKVAPIITNLLIPG